MKIRSRYASGVSCGSYGKYGKYGSRQRGQALTEFLVLAVALLPLLLLMPVLAKYQDISSATQMASRYAAFDAMSRNDATGSSWKPEAELAAEISRRFFSSPNTPIRTGEGAGNGKSQQNLFWRDPQDNALIRDLNADVTLAPAQPMRAASRAPPTARSSSRSIRCWTCARVASTRPMCR
jgi:hypothetical protein